MTTNNSVNVGLSGATGTGNFVGSASPTITGTPTIATYAKSGANSDVTSLTGLTGVVQAPTAIASSAGLNALAFTYTSTSVNYLTVTNNTTGNKPILSATGSDSNIIFQLQGKGTGGVEILGTSTNNNATAGYVGELISSQVVNGSAVSLSNNTPKDVTTITLTAGDWDVDGHVYNAFSVGATLTSSWCSLTSATTPDASIRSGTGMASALMGDQGNTTPLLRVSVSAGSTTVYLSTIALFASGTGTASGIIQARRVR